MAHSYKARLIFASRIPGIFNWDAGSHRWTLPTGQEGILFARPDGPLASATEFHVDIGGFKTQEEAREAGESLRAGLRMANALLTLGLHIPTAGEEVRRARLAPHVKEKLSKEYGTKIADCVFGLNVLSEVDELEFVSRATLNARPKDSAFILEAANAMWGIEDNLDERSRRAAELLNAASSDSSQKSAFLITYLALEVLMTQQERSGVAQKVLAELREVVDKSDLEGPERERLRSYLGEWKRTSIAVEIDNFVSLGSNEKIVVQGEPLREFLRNCRNLRNRITHPAKKTDQSVISDKALRGRRDGLREVILGFIWA